MENGRGQGWVELTGERERGKKIRFAFYDTRGWKGIGVLCFSMQEVGPSTIRAWTWDSVGSGPCGIAG